MNSTQIKAAIAAGAVIVIGGAIALTSSKKLIMAIKGWLFQRLVKSLLTKQ